MDINKMKGTQLCRNCSFCDLNNRGRCTNPKAKKVWAINQRNGCDYFDGEVLFIDWDKAVPVGYRPSTFSK